MFGREHFPSKFYLQYFGTCSHCGLLRRRSPNYSELGVLPGMFSPKRRRWPPIFFTFLTSLTHHLSMVRGKVNVRKFSRERLPINIENPTTGRKIRIFFYCVKKTLLGNFFQKYTFKVSANSHFCEICRKVRNTAQSTKMAVEICPKLYIFNTQYRKKGTCLDFIFTRFVIYPSVILLS